MVNTTTLGQDHRKTNVARSRAQIMSSVSFCTRTKLSLRLCSIYKALLSIRESLEKKRRRFCIYTGHVQTINSIIEAWFNTAYNKLENTILYSLHHLIICNPNQVS